MYIDSTSKKENVFSLFPASRSIQILPFSMHHSRCFCRSVCVSAIFVWVCLSERWVGMDWGGNSYLGFLGTSCCKMATFRHWVRGSSAGVTYCKSIGRMCVTVRLWDDNPVNSIVGIVRSGPGLGRLGQECLSSDGKSESERLTDSMPVIQHFQRRFFRGEVAWISYMFVLRHSKPSWALISFGQ